MEQPGPSGSEINDEIDRKMVDAVAATGTVDKEQTADILKLDIDCFEELFDYLSLMQIFCLSKTCKRLNHVTGYWFQENYSNIHIKTDGDIMASDYKYFTKHTKNNKIKYRKTWYGEYRLEKNFLKDLKQFRQFKEIEFFHIQLSYLKYIYKGETRISRKINQIKDLLGKIQFLHLHRCSVENQHEAILALCPNLRGLRLTGINLSNTDPTLHHGKYPNLEHFEYFEDYRRSNDKLYHIMTFLELNPNMRSFAASAEFLRKNEQSMMSSDIKLDDLAILIDSESQLNQLCALLKKLYERNFYGRLKIYFMNQICQQQIDQLGSLSGLVKLYCMNSSNEKIAISALKNVEEIRYCDSEKIRDMKAFATLPNLKWVSFVYTTFDDILILLSKAVNLTKIRVEHLKYFSPKFSKDCLTILNNAREQLDETSKVTIYVEESIYLKVKWEMKQQEFELIKLKRHESFDRNHDFCANGVID